MASDTHHARRPLRRALLVLLVLVLLGGAAVGGVALVRPELLDRWFGEPRDLADPAAIAPPSGLDLPPVSRPAPVATPVTAQPLGAAPLEQALAPLLADGDLGPHVLARVVPLDAARPAFSSERGRAGDLAMPASTTKVVTSAAALFALGPDHRFATTVLDDGRSGGARRLVLVGGGDPLLARTAEPDDYPQRADVATLAAQTAAALRRDGVDTVRLGFDDSLFTGPAVNPTWEPGYVATGEAAPTSALWVDEGRVAPDVRARSEDPALDAARAFATALAQEGLTVQADVARTTAGTGAEIARVESPPLAQIVERLLLVSDNDASEVLLRHVGLAQEGEGSSAAGQQGVERILGSQQIPMRGSVLHDGSGLSRQNLLAPQVLTDVLRWAASPDQPGLRAVVTGLPVAGFSGSLADRMDQGAPQGRGRVHAKTGTLSGVSSLAGIATDLEGRPMVFALMADRVPEDRSYFGQVALDNAAAALGACRCG